jgi:hypothetical protein
MNIRATPKEKKLSMNGSTQIRTEVLIKSLLPLLRGGESKLPVLQCSGEAIIVNAGVLKEGVLPLHRAADGCGLMCVKYGEIVIYVIRRAMGWGERSEGRQVKSSGGVLNRLYGCGPATIELHMNECQLLLQMIYTYPTRNPQRVNQAHQHHYSYDAIARYGNLEITTYITRGMKAAVS